MPARDIDLRKFLPASRERTVREGRLRNLKKRFYGILNFSIASYLGFVLRRGGSVCKSDASKSQVVENKKIG